MAAAEKQLKFLPPHKLTPYFNNPRKNDSAVEGVAESIAAFGFQSPILADENHEILAGHTRWKAAIKLDLKKIPVVITNGLTDEQKVAYRIADNKYGETAEWDLDKLALEIEKAGEFPTGFSADEIDEIGRQIAPAFEGQTDDEVPEDVEPRTQPGDLWQLSRHRLLCGDATNADDVARLLDGNNPQLMVTDPPYGVDYHPEWRQEAAENGHLAYSASRVGRVNSDDRVDWRDAWVLFQGGVAYVWHADRHASEVQAGLEFANFDIRCQVIWSKSNFPISRGHYHWRHEPCWYAVRKGATAMWIGDRKQTTVWEINLDKNVDGGHSTQKPVECMERPIRNHSGDVYDPFCGSGTTIIAAEKQSRTCYAMEIDPHYCDVIVQRWENYTGQKAEQVEQLEAV